MLAVSTQILQLDTAWRMKAQKEQLAQLGRKVKASQAEQDSTEAELLQKERRAAEQVYPDAATLSPTGWLAG